MKKHSVLVLFLFSSILFSFKGYAQDQNSSKKHEEIILRKEGTFPKDLTIHIQGDKITINGKTPSDIDVIRKKSSGNGSELQEYNHSGRSLMPHSFSFNGNGGQNGDGHALLGVLTLRNDSSKGAKIEQVEKGTAADSAGLQKGDIISKVNDQKISSPEDLSAAIKSFKPNDKISITYLRNGEKYTKEIKLGRMDNWGSLGAMGMGRTPNSPFRMMPPGHPGNMQGMMQWFRNHHPAYGMSGQSGPHLGIIVENRTDHHGIDVVRVKPGSAAAKAGFQPDDILISFSGKKINDIQSIQQELETHKNDKTVKATVQRNNKKVVLKITMPQTPQQSASL